MVKRAVPFTVLIVVDESVAVMPAGNAPSASVIGELKLFWATTLTVVLKEAPAVRAKELTSVLRVKTGNAYSTVSNRLTLCETVLLAAGYGEFVWPGGSGSRVRSESECWFPIRVPAG